MNYSKINFRLKAFIDSNFPRNFNETPEMYLGPNYRSVMNFYNLYYNNELRFIDNKNSVASVADFNSLYNHRLRETVLEVVSESIRGRLPFPLPVFELITMHLLLERGETLKYIPLFTISDKNVNNEF
jgi:hypothetical protein